MKTLLRFICPMALILALLTGCKEPEGRQTYAWAIATASPENTITGIFANRFAEEIRQLSGGKMRVQVYHNSVLGGDTELLESCQCGDIPFVVQNTAPEVSYMPELCLFDLPCVFQDERELHRVLDDTLFIHKVNKIYEKKGFHLLAMGDQHFRLMTSNRKIGHLSDFRGIKIRTMENALHLKFWKLLGANPTPLAFSELYVALEQHTVDAQENPLEVICSNGFYEVQKYIVETNHLPHLLALVTNDGFYRKLTPQQRVVVDLAAAKARDYSRREAQIRADSKIREALKGGAEYLRLSPWQRKRMKEAAEPLYREIRSRVKDQALFERYTLPSGRPKS